MKNQSNTLSAMDDNGNPVDWWFLYKVAGKSVASDGSKATGNEYVYFDSSGPQGKKLTLSPHLMSDASKGAVSNTLNQIYNNLDDPDLGWFFYNDEDPITEKTNSERGHTKGVLCFNLETNSAFWMIHSTPKFSLKDAYGFPETATGNGQTFLCITLKDADTAKAIAAQMYVAQQPNVFLASKVPASMDSDDPRAQLINNTVAPGKTSYANFITFTSRAGQSFKCIARNKYWDTAGDDDFYNDLVGPALGESLEVETWEHDPVPGDMDDDKVHTVNAMKEVNLAPLGFTPSFAWSEENDHAKLAVSAQNEPVKYVCVGDLNFTIAQEKRSGGTVAFINDDLWASISEILCAADTLSNSPKARIKKNKNI
ncbi:MAG TPA: deoxyribonuclease II family protein [Pyrinomonadaceae bacterium]|jgi:deoxyribonuclease-2